MLNTIIQASRTKKRRGRKNGRVVKTNSKGLSFESLEFSDYNQVRDQIDKLVGKRPPLYHSAPKGNWTPQALKVLQERYLLKDRSGKVIETPEEMCWRVAWEVASSEAIWGAKKTSIIEIAKRFYQLMVSREFLPNSPTLMNAGTRNGLQYSACFVLPIEDSLVGIFDALKWQALIHQTGGGTGFSFSRLRPKGSMVKTSRGTASGPVSFMKIFDAATNEIKQGGKRRGANMGILRVDHPDILDFIRCKRDGGITNFNISVALTDNFMKAYQRGGEYSLIDPRTGKAVGKASAVEVFDKICQQAWETGDPGLVFIDRINKSPANPVPSLGPIESTNPCGEQPLYPFDSCNLGSIFLNHFVKEEGEKKSVDWARLIEVTKLAVRFLDDVIEVNPYTLPQIRKMTLAIRRIGLGVGGWADMLIRLGIPYDSEKAMDLAEKIMKLIQETAVESSRELARERGPFPLWPISIYKNELPRRNSTVTTIAPTGTISIIAGSSSGIEPIFAVVYQHVVSDKHIDRRLTFVNPNFQKILEEKGLDSEDLIKKVMEKGTVREIKEIPEDIKRIFITAHEIDPKWHIRVQAVFQKYTENAVSKTINLRHEAGVNDVKRAYLLAWETGCKGITIFRDGSRTSQVLNLGVKDGDSERAAGGGSLRERPFKVTGSTYRLGTPVGTAFVTINQDQNGDPLEVFINVGKAGSDVAAMAEALGRTISTSLRLKGSLTSKERAYEIAKQLSGIGGRRSVGFGPNKIRSLPDAIAAALSYHCGFKINGNGNHIIENKADVNYDQVKAALNVAEAVMAANGSAPADQPALAGSDDPTAASAAFNETLVEGPGDICPACGASALIFEEGCEKCHACGYSEC